MFSLSVILCSVYGIYKLQIMISVVFNSVYVMYKLQIIVLPYIIYSTNNNNS